MHKLGGDRTCNYDNFHQKQTLYGERIPKDFVKKIKIGTFSATLRFGRFGLSVTIGCSTNKYGINPRLNTLWGMTLLCLPRWLGLGWLHMLRLSAYSTEALLKGLTKRRGLGTSFLIRIGWESLGIGNVNICRWFDTLILSLGGLGLSLADRVGWCPWLGGLSLVGSCYSGLCYSLCDGVAHLRGSTSSQNGCYFLGV